MYGVTANSAPKILGVASVLLLMLVAVAVLFRGEYMITVIVQSATIVSLGLAVASSGLAIYQLRQVEKTNSSLLDISKSMSTKFAGRFPNHIPEITRLLELAENKVSIVCDLLGYGYYSSPEQYQEYRAAVLKLSKKVPVRITIYGAREAERAARQQLGEDFDVISKSQTYRNYLKFYKITPEEAPTNTKEFYARWTKDYEKQCVEYNIGKIVIHQVKEKAIPVYFWIIDERDAIFSFPSLSVDPPEVAFSTSDRNLLDIFQRILLDVDPTPIEGETVESPETGAVGPR